MDLKGADSVEGQICLHGFSTFTCSNIEWVSWGCTAGSRKGQTRSTLSPQLSSDSGTTEKAFIGDEG